jgi:hypothetical protein
LTFSRMSAMTGRTAPRSVYLKDKPDDIIKYEQRLKEATFAYSKADLASRKGRRKAVKKLSGSSDKLFERLLEFLNHQIAGDHLLEMWLDRDACFDASNAPVGGQRISHVLLHHAVCVTMVVDFWATYKQLIRLKLMLLNGRLTTLQLSPWTKI